MFNTYGESIENQMLSISKRLNDSGFLSSKPHINFAFPIDNNNALTKSIEENPFVPYWNLLDSVEGRLIELNKMPFARLNANRYEYSTLLYNLNKSCLWVYDEHEYPTFRKYCKAKLSISNEAVTMYLKTGKYMLMHDKPLNVFGNQDFSISKLYTLSVIPLSELRALVISNAITPDMTARDIQAFVREYRQKQAVSHEG